MIKKEKKKRKKYVRIKPVTEFKRRTDQCFKCKKRNCYYRIFTIDGVFDEISCEEHVKKLTEKADRAIGLAGQHLRWNIKSSKRVKRGTYVELLLPDMEALREKYNADYDAYIRGMKEFYGVNQIVDVCIVCGRKRKVTPRTPAEEERFKYRVRKWTCLRCREKSYYAVRNCKKKKK